MDNILITDEDLKLQVHHIGGIGDSGPAELFVMLGDDAFWTFYDIDKESLEKTTIKNKNHKLINKGIGRLNEKAKFNITCNPTASSCLIPANSAKNYLLPGTNTTWKDHTIITKTIDIELTNLNTLIEKKEIEKIDFLSIDAQGLELDIIYGAGININDILGIVSEVEFRKLYEDQPLFSDLSKELNNRGFDLWALYNLQYFNTQNYPKPLLGNGMLMTAEALFVRNPEPLFERFDKASNEETSKIIIKLIKLAIIGVIYDQREFSIDILHRLEEKGIFLKDIEKYSKIDYIKKMRGSMELANSIMKSEVRWNT